MALYEVWCSHCNAPHNSSLTKGSDLSKNIYAGSSAWVKSSESESGWELAEVLSRCGSSVTIRTKTHEGTDKLRVIDLDSQHNSVCLPANEELAMDMTELHFTHEPAIIHNLRSRAEAKEPYTFIGSVLVSINPLQRVPEPADFEIYPHPRTMAERAYNKMEFARSQLVNAGEDPVNVAKALKEFGPINQSILISGESGSGKTESAKRVLIHLVDRQEYDEFTLEARPDLYDFQEKIIGSDPILESFGNAKTKRNPNSSRFGKFLRLFYDSEEDYPEDMILCGASITTYLLERSRVTYQEPGERNFRVFYQLMASSPGFLTEMGLDKADSIFNYLGGKKIDKNMIDKTGYIELLTSFQMAQLHNKTRDIFKVVAAILHIGNISFDADSTSEGEVVRVRETYENEEEGNTESYSALAFAAQLLGVEQKTLKDLLTITYVDVGGEKIVKRKDLHSAIRTRDAVAKHIYSLLFEWIVFRLNGNMRVANYNEDDINVSYIGVLDVFGFEQFETNGFEQLLINYANEILLTLFTNEILIGESEIYKSEGLVLQDGDIPKISSTDSPSSNCIKLFTGNLQKGKSKYQGLFTILDNQGRVPSPSESKFLAELQKSLKGNKAFLDPHPSERRNKFIVKHYAADVKYTIGTFLEKNDDSLPLAIEALFRQSSHLIVKRFPELLAALLARAKGKQKKKKNVKKSVAKQFTDQISFLKKTLQGTSSSYIRCIKPNPKLFNPQFKDVQEEAPVIRGKKVETVIEKSVRSVTVKKKRDEDRYFDTVYVSQQLRNLGIFDAVNVLKSGLPTRIPYPSIIRSFSNIIDMDAIPFFKERKDHFKDKFFVSALMWAFSVPRTAYRLGYTRIFFAGGQLDVVKDILKSASMWSSLPNGKERAKILKRFRFYYARYLWRNAYIKIVAQNHFLRSLKHRRAAIKIQALVRGYQVRQEVSEKLLSERMATKIQCVWRSLLARRELARLKLEKTEQEEMKVLKEYMDKTFELLEEVAKDKEKEKELEEVPSQEEEHNFSTIAPKLEKFFYKRDSNNRRSQDRDNRGSLFSIDRIRQASAEEWFDIENMMLDIEFEDEEALFGQAEPVEQVDEPIEINKSVASHLDDHDDLVLQLEAFENEFGSLNDIDEDEEDSVNDNDSGEISARVSDPRMKLPEKDSSSKTHDSSKKKGAEESRDEHFKGKKSPHAKISRLTRASNMLQRSLPRRTSAKAKAKEKEKSKSKQKATREKYLKL